MPPRCWRMGCSSAQQSRKNLPHGPKVAFSGSRAAPETWTFRPQASCTVPGGLAVPNHAVSMLTDPRLTCFSVSFLTHLPRSYSLPGPVIISLPRLWETENRCPEAKAASLVIPTFSRLQGWQLRKGSFCTRGYHGHIQTLGRSGHSFLGLILNCPALNHCQLYKASANVQVFHMSSI